MERVRALRIPVAYLILQIYCMVAKYLLLILLTLCHEKHLLKIEMEFTT